MARRRAVLQHAAAPAAVVEPNEHHVRLRNALANVRLDFATFYELTKFRREAITAAIEALAMDEAPISRIDRLRAENDERYSRPMKWKLIIRNKS